MAKERQKEVTKQELRRKILELIEDLKEFNESHREELTDQIIEQIETISSSKSYVRAIIEETEIGQQLFRTLQDYIRTRYSSLLELVRSDLESLSPPSASGRLSFEAGLLGNFPITQTALSVGITAPTIKDALTSLQERGKPQPSVKTPSKQKKPQKAPRQIERIRQKREKTSQLRRSLRNEIKRANQEVPLSNLLSRRNRLVSKGELADRIVALTSLLTDHQLKIKERNGRRIVKRAK